MVNSLFAASVLPGHDDLLAVDAGELPGLRTVDDDVVVVRLDGEVLYGTLRAGVGEPAGRYEALLIHGQPVGVPVAPWAPRGTAEAVRSIAQQRLPDQADLVAAASELAVRTGARWVLNLAPVGPIDPAVLARADPLVVNEHEARELLGGDHADPARALTGLGPRSAVVTLGGDGAAWCSGDESGLVPPVPAETVVDTTGAGDAFTAALAVGLGLGLHLPDAVRSGAAAGAWAVGSDGANPDLPRWSDLVEWQGGSRGRR